MCFLPSDGGALVIFGDVRVGAVEQVALDWEPVVGQDNPDGIAHSAVTAAAVSQKWIETGAAH